MFHRVNPPSVPLLHWYMIILFVAFPWQPSKLTAFKACSICHRCCRTLHPSIQASRDLGTLLSSLHPLPLIETRLFLNESSLWFMFNYLNWTRVGTWSASYLAIFGIMTVCVMLYVIRGIPPFSILTLDEHKNVIKFSDVVFMAVMCKGDSHARLCILTLKM